MASSRRFTIEGSTAPSLRGPPVVKLKPIDRCSTSCSLLMRRRTSRRSSLRFDENSLDVSNQLLLNQPRVIQPQLLCNHCDGKLSQHEQIILNGKGFHKKCFVCAQCFKPFSDGTFYEHKGRRYCAHDFKMLFAPACEKCKMFVVGPIIKSMNSSWHPKCFVCDICASPLSQTGFKRNANRALCLECHNKVKALEPGRYLCHKCHSVIVSSPLWYKSEVYHPYHFNCNECHAVLNSGVKEVNGELLCLKCYEWTIAPTCDACRLPVEENVVYAMGKAWHADHFSCPMCLKPFHGSQHYERGGRAYCAKHYDTFIENPCFVCNSPVNEQALSAFNKKWCLPHFACFYCDKEMTYKTKFYEFDLKPVCRRCFKKFPSELRKRLKNQEKQQKLGKPKEQKKTKYYDMACTIM